MLYKETKALETTPKNKPNQEKWTSPKEPMRKPSMTTTLARIAAKEVTWPNIKYVNEMVKQIVRERATCYNICHFFIFKKLRNLMTYLIESYFDIK